MQHRVAPSPDRGRRVKELSWRPHCLNINIAHVPPLASVFSMRQLNVLLVEDDDSARALYSYMLAAAGYNVKAVSNGLEALTEIDVNRPDVILTDILMPILNGLDLITIVRANNDISDLPIVVITSFREGLREQARAAGATDVIDKSTEMARVREVIEAAVSRPRL